MKKQSSRLRQAVEELLNAVLSHGIEACPTNNVSLARLTLGKRTGGRLSGPQLEPVHCLDITTMTLPLLVDQWELNLDGERKPLCLLSAIRIGTSVQTMLGLSATDAMSIAAVFQVCQHGEHCTNQPPRFTSRIGDFEEKREYRGSGVLSYVLLANEETLTLLSPVPDDQPGEQVTVTLMVHPNRFKVIYGYDN